jgi:hypothetical protein
MAGAATGYSDYYKRTGSTPTSRLSGSTIGSSETPSAFRSRVNVEEEDSKKLAIRRRLKRMKVGYGSAKSPR